MKENYECLVRTKKIKTKKERAQKLSSLLKELYPDAECSLDYKNDPFRLLVMARLSAQCTDKRVNEVSEKLFEVLPDAKSFAEADLETIEELIKSCGLYKMKAKNIKEMSCQLIERHGGEVPRDKEALLALSGVGIKIANLIMGDLFSDPYIVPDTHCIRIAHRTGLISKPDPSVCIRELDRLIDKKERSDFCHRIVLFGRDICRAQNPACFNCPLFLEEKE